MLCINHQMLEIQDFDPQHAPALRRIYRDSRRLAFPWLNPAELALSDFDRATQDERILVALHERTPVGFIAWWPPDNFVHSLFVDPPFLGKGVGKALLQACLDQLGRPATLKCLLSNERALRFYTALGWQVLTHGESGEGPYVVLIVH